MNKILKKQTTDFLKCGLIGWGMECLWTGCGSLCGEKNKKMPCQTSIWMFPIYGMASVLSPLCKKMQGRHVLVRGSVYTACIFLTEYSTGSFLKNGDAARGIIVNPKQIIKESSALTTPHSGFWLG